MIRKSIVGLMVGLWVMAAANAFAYCVETCPDGTNDFNGFCYTESGGEITITDYAGSDTDIDIPAEINGNPVLSIGDDAFSYCENLTSVTIPDSVTSIGDMAFYACTGLTSIKIPDSVTSIGDSAFDDCTSLASVTIGNSVTSIGDLAFSWCSSLTGIIIPDSVIIIGNSAFQSCENLASVTIGNSVTSIGDSAFSDCYSLTSVTIGNSVTSIAEYAFASCTSLASLTIPASVTSIGNGAFEFCTGLTSINVDPANVNYSSDAAGVLYNSDKSVLICYPPGKTDTSYAIPDSVTGIRSGAFYSCTNLTSVTIPDSVTSIGEYAFSSCTSLTVVTIPDSVTSIGAGAFASCTGLTGVGIPDSVTSIGDYAFFNCSSLTDVTIPDSVTSIGNGAFDRCSSLTRVTIGNSVTSIGLNAFAYCGSLTGVTIPDSVTSIGGSAFQGCENLTGVTIGNSVTSIGWGAFAFCTSLTGVIIPDGVTSIEGDTFYSCASLASVAIPDSVTSIGLGAFRECTSLTSVTIPASVSNIGYEAFVYCELLSSASFLGNAPAMEGAVFVGTAPDFHICYTPEASGFSSPTWEGYPAEPCASADNPPSLGDGPFVAAGTWPLLSASQQSPTYLNQNYSVLWTFSDDFASCEEACTHSAEYQMVGDSEWTVLTVSSDAAQGYAWVELPIAQLQNAATYEFRFTVTDCAGQTTQSAAYYFRVATSDAPPVITGGPWLAAGAWPVLPTSASRAVVLNQDRAVLWTFSDDYASCAGLCTHRARYRRVGDTAWTWIPVETDPAGDWYAYTTLPVSSLENGTYQFYFDVRDCAGQRTSAPKVYYFKADR